MRLGPADEALLDAVVDLSRTVFGDDLLGGFLHGSAVLGGLVATSDLDILLVVDRSATAPRRRMLVDGLLEVSGRRARRGPARPVELTVVVQSEVRPWRYPPVMDFLYGEWLRGAYASGVVPEPEPSPDTALVVAAVLLGDHPVVGPRPAELLDPVPAADVARASTEGVEQLLQDLDTDTRNVLLTLARVWTTVETGTIRPKDDAADWALERLQPEHGAALARARDMYRDGRDVEVWGDLPAVRAEAAELLRRIGFPGRPLGETDNPAPER